MAVQSKFLEGIEDLSLLLDTAWFKNRVAGLICRLLVLA